MPQGFAPGEALKRERPSPSGLVREFGEVDSRLPDGRVVVAVKRYNGETLSTETFHPNQTSAGWTLRG